MASAVVGALRILLSADAAELQSGLNTAGRSLDGFARKAALTQGDISGIGREAGLIPGIVGRIGPALAGAFTIAAIAKVTGDFIDMSGALVDLEAKTGINVTGLQRLKLATQESGVGLNDVAGAALQLQKRLGEGKESTVGAMTALGLSFAEVRKQSPEDALFLVGDAVGKITDQNEKVAVLNDLFGRQGMQILPALNGHLKETADAYERMGLVMDEQVIRAGDKLGDQWTVLKSAGGALLAQVLGPLVPMFTDLAEAVIKVSTTGAPIAKWALEQVGLPFEKAIHLVRDLTASFDLLTLKSADLPTIKAPTLDVPKAAGLATLSLEEMREAEDKLTESAKKSIAEHEKAARALEQEAEAAKRFRDIWSGSNAFEAARKLTDEIVRLGGATKLTADEQRRALSTLQDAIDKYSTLGQQAPPAVMAITVQLDAMITRLKDGNQEAALLIDTIERALVLPPIPTLPTGAEGGFDLHPPVEEVRAAGKGIGGTILAGIGDTFKTSFGPTILGAIQGGGNIGQSIGSLLGQSITGSLAQSLATKFPALFEGVLGGIFGSILPGIGALLGPVFGKISDFFSGLFGVSKEVQESRKSLEQFQQTLRSTLTDTQKAEAGTEGWRQDVVRVRDAYLATGRTVAEALRITEQLWDTDHPDRQRAAMEEINRVLEEEKRLAGEAADAIEDQAEAAEAARQAFEDAKQEAGGLVSEIEGLVESADGLPASIQPYIDKLLELGLITDEQAQKLRGLRAEGEVDWARMKDAAERYGVDLDSLGGRFQSGRLHASAQAIINDFGLLTRGGADVGGVLLGMSDEISALVRDSLKFGTTIPANMRPWIEELARSGHLIDDQGNKIENLDKINFGDDLKDEALIAKEGFENIIKKLDELIAKITGPLTDALDKISKDRTIEIDIKFNEPEIPRSLIPDRNVPLVPPGFGTGGFVSRPTLALIGESEPEWIVPQSRVGGFVSAAMNGKTGSFGPTPSFDIPIPRVDFGSFIDRSDPFPGNREGGGDRNVTTVIVPVIIDNSPASTDAILAHVNREIKRTLPEDVALDQFELSTKLVPLLAGRVADRLRR